MFSYQYFQKIGEGGGEHAESTTCRSAWLQQLYSLVTEYPSQ